MTELERIHNNNNGEVPPEAYEILRIKDVADPQDELDTFKKTITAILENIDLNCESRKWEKLLPKKVVAFTNQVLQIKHSDDLISNIANIVGTMQEIKKWEWYSSKLVENGFEVIVTGDFLGIFLPMIHHQGIPHASMFIESEGKEYPTNAIIDVMTHKKFDAKTYKLS